MRSSHGWHCLPCYYYLTNISSNQSIMFITYSSKQRNDIIKERRSVSSRFAFEYIKLWQHFHYEMSLFSSSYNSVIHKRKQFSFRRRRRVGLKPQTIFYKILIADGKAEKKGYYYFNGVASIRILFAWSTFIIFKT